MNLCITYYELLFFLPTTCCILIHKGLIEFFLHFQDFSSLVVLRGAGSVSEQIMYIFKFLVLSTCFATTSIVETSGRNSTKIRMVGFHLVHEDRFHSPTDRWFPVVPTRVIAQLETLSRGCSSSPQPSCWPPRWTAGTWPARGRASPARRARGQGGVQAKETGISAEGWLNFLREFNANCC